MQTDVLSMMKEDSVGYTLAHNTLHLPIDQRYREVDLKRILTLIEKNI